jgi:hypothetical protein
MTVTPESSAVIDFEAAMRDRDMLKEPPPTMIFNEHGLTSDEVAQLRLAQKQATHRSANRSKSLMLATTSSFPIRANG